MCIDVFGDFHLYFAFSMALSANAQEYTTRTRESLVYSMIKSGLSLNSG